MPTLALPWHSRSQRCSQLCPELYSFSHVWVHGHNRRIRSRCSPFASNAGVLQVLPALRSPACRSGAWAPRDGRDVYHHQGDRTHVRRTHDTHSRALPNRHTQTDAHTHTRSRARSLAHSAQFTRSPSCLSKLNSSHLTHGPTSCYQTSFPTDGCAGT